MSVAPVPSASETPSANSQATKGNAAEPQSAERLRLKEDASRTINWKRWGPYLSERQWGTVREDYSPFGECWDYLSHEQSRSRAYRWGEDGLMGISDRQCRLCFSISLWNGKDAILKERLFGLTGPEGNHGEDVKECYYYLDSSPTHSYMKMLYKYPQNEFPYAALVHENRIRGKDAPEYELIDTGVFNDNRYFDVTTEYAKQSPDDILIRITVSNRGPEESTIHLLPTLWFRNSWSWGCSHDGCEVKPRLRAAGDKETIVDHGTLGRYRLFCDASPHGDSLEMLYTENETHSEKLFGVENESPYVKDAFHRYVIDKEMKAVNPKRFGTKVAAHYVLTIAAGDSLTIHLRLVNDAAAIGGALEKTRDEIFAQRIAETDAFYASLMPEKTDPERCAVARQAYAGLLTTKQFYHYVVNQWLDGDPAQPPPPENRKHGRNQEWRHLFNRDIISMPDKWEYPWYAAWDLAFHMIPMAKVDPDFAKEQLLLFLREWYMHPNGQLPAYEFAFSDVNPPVHAWACWRVYKIADAAGNRDTQFLKRAFHKLLLNFNWWVNRKDPRGKNLFAGGFLGLDNIGVFDRSQPLPTGGHLEQADGTAWMAFYCSTMLTIAIELAKDDDTYEDIASKFFEHFVAITDAMNGLGGTGLWDEQDGFYYDVLNANDSTMPLRIRSMVGIIPLFAVEILDQNVLDKLPGFTKRLEWFMRNRSDLSRQISYMDQCDVHSENVDPTQRLLAIPSKRRLERMLKYLLDENEFLSDYGIRALSKVHAEHPFVFRFGGQEHCVSYVPGESSTRMFGGNSNWRGPIWFPVNYLVVESLERYHHFYGDTFQVECPTGSGVMMNLGEVAAEISRRLTKIFLPEENGHRACHGTDSRYASDPHWRELVLFYEYFHGDSGRGVGASHQTGWTALVATLLES
jgi:hypothetical protein